MFLEKRAEAFEAASIYNKIFHVLPSRQFAEKFTSLTAMEGFQPVGENGAHPVDGIEEGYSKFFEHETWKDSFAISREMIDDAKTIDLKKRPLSFITGYHRTREMFAAALLGTAMGGSTTVTFRKKVFDLTGADGLCLFHTAHTSKTGGATQGNQFSNAMSAEGLGKIQTAMQNFTDDNGNPLDISPDTIIIPNDAAIKKLVFETIGSDKSPETANNAFNYQFGMWNVYVWPYLNAYVDEGDAPFILLDSRYNEEFPSAVWLDRVPLEVSSKIDDDTDANVWRGYARFTAGFNDWRAFAIGGIDGATALS